MRIGIVGWGLEAQSAFRYFGSEHEYLIVNEQPADNFPPETNKIKIQFLPGRARYGPRGQIKDLSYLKGVEDCDKIVYQPTAYFNLKKTYPPGSAFWAKATTIYDIFFENAPTSKIIGVTGTKGKGTTSTLIYKMLKAAGLPTHIGGNVGTPILDIMPKIDPDDWLVWELANFQLRPASHSPHIAVCLAIEPEHLDWHPDMEDYVEAKGNIFRFQNAADIAIYYAQNKYSKKIAVYSPGQKIPYFKEPGCWVRPDGMITIGGTELIHESNVKLLGKHNLENICAAVTAVWQISQNPDSIRKVLKTFSGLAHRLELVQETGGIKFYNDSFAANPEASSAAIKAIKTPKIMILGGYERSLPLDRLTKTIAENRPSIKKLVLIGQSAARLSGELKRTGFSDFVISKHQEMPAILNTALEYAQAGDSIVLSPGFASFDMFENFEVRGNEFKKAVSKL